MSLARDLRSEPLACDPTSLCDRLGLLGKFKRQHGRDVLICCPWHPDTDPSCSVRVAKDGTISAKCFSCDASADAIGLVRQVLGLDHRGALEELARMTGRYDVSDDLQKPPHRTAPTVIRIPVEDARPISVDEYHALASALLEACPLDGHPAIVAYLRERGIYADAQAWGLGALPSRPDQPALVAMLLQTFTPATLEAAGLVDGPAFKWPDHQVILPWRNRKGEITALQRRSFDVGGRKYVFPRALPPIDPFGAEHFDAALEFHRLGGREPEIAFTEGALDALAHAALCRHFDGVRIVLGIPSATTWDPRWADYAKGLDAVIAVDADKAGDDVAEKMKVDLTAAGATSVRRVLPANGANDWCDALKGARS